MSEQITFQDSPVGDARPRSLRARLGPLGFTLALVAVVVASFILGAGISLAVKMVRRPPIVAPTHGVISQAVVAHAHTQR
jgi:hypothetical protein